MSPRPALAAWLAAVLLAAVAAPAVARAVAISPELARAIYDDVASLGAAGGCRLSRFDTHRDRILIGLTTPAGAEQVLEVGADGGGRRAGDWLLRAPPALERDCGATLAAIAAALAGHRLPSAGWSQLAGTREWLTELSLERADHQLIAVAFALLVVWTAAILLREWRARRPPAAALATLALISSAGLALRLLLSPRTFLHEYYHIAETISGYLAGQHAPAYGNTGPTLFRLAASLTGAPDDVRVIFFTNAVLAAFAVPAVALLDLAWLRRWPHALCAAALLAVLPHHLRFSAAEDLLVQAVTFGMWTLALFALYARSGRLGDALCGALALALAVQTRPEMLFFPGVVVALLALIEAGSWRRLLDWRAWLAGALTLALLVPRLLDLQSALQSAPSPTPRLPALGYYLSRLVLFDGAVTPPLYWLLLAAGSAWTALRQPRLLAWVALVYGGFTLFSLSLYDNPIFNLRAQILPTSYTVLLAAGAAPLWLAAWGRPRRRTALAAGAALLALFAAGTVVARRGFVTELRDQQLQWAFLARTVPALPARGRLLAAVEVGGRKFDAFPDLLLRRSDKHYTLIDVRRSAAGEEEWPAAGDDLLFYQGMYCYFAVEPDSPPPDPLAPECLAVHQRYVLTPVVEEVLDAPGYSLMPYAPGPFRVGFYRLTPR